MGCRLYGHNAEHFVSRRQILGSSREYYHWRTQWRLKVTDGYKPTEPGTDYGPSVFEDDFNFLDFEKWRHEITLGGGGNWEFQFYHNNRSSSFVSGGNLHLKPVLTTEYLGISDKQLINGALIDLWGNSPGFQCTANAYFGCVRSSDGKNIVNPIMSAQLRTHQSFSFRYGKVEVRAKLPRGDCHAYGGWPASGEIDLMESRGNAPGYHGQGVDTVASTLHWGPYWKYNKHSLTTANYTLPYGKTFADEFHVFTLEWTPEFIRTMSKSLWEFGGFEESSLLNPWRGAKRNAPFDQKFYIIINLAVGGTNNYFPEEPITCTGNRDLNTTVCSLDNRKPWKNTSPTAPKDFILRKQEWYPTWFDSKGSNAQSEFLIDYIRVYPMA
ncbi:3-glucan binding protein [Massospora cicadina]|nr:3-glucan binding protein [Massospora cicadina]